MKITIRIESNTKDIHSKLWTAIQAGLYACNAIDCESDINRIEYLSQPLGDKSIIEYTYTDNH